jgi:hypothetical protein
MTASEAGETEVQARRRRPGRPPTVPLSEFGKEPPPPPAIQVTPRQIAIGVAVGLVVIAVLWVILVYFGGIANARWSQTRCLDVRVEC